MVRVPLLCGCRPFFTGKGMRELSGRRWDPTWSGRENVLYLKLGSGYIGGYTRKNAYDFTVSKLHFILKKKKGRPPPFDNIAH